MKVFESKNMEIWLYEDTEGLFAVWIGYKKTGQIRIDLLKPIIELFGNKDWVVIP